MLSVRSILVPISLACAALAAPACDSHVPLGTVGFGGMKVLWSAGFEPGDLSEWTFEDDGSTYVDNSSVAPAASTDIAHSGRYSGKSTMFATMGALGMPSSDYFYRNRPSPQEAYYSAWFYIPSTALVRTWLSLIHFRVSSTGDGMNVTPIWDLNVYPRLADGTLTTHLYNYVTRVNAEQLVNNTVPVDRWVHFEFLLRRAADATGRVAVWQDDVAIVDLENIVTAPTDWVQWDVGGSSDDIEPSPSSIYIDDAAISLDRLGSGTVADELTPPQQ